ncbi:hypothetical protein [Thermococcus sp. MV11]|uniref:hypothetical protein n=1 Tax=Thermococcus sp. MV11 TaxID=1638267 RepID=UPI00143163EF|nr:hypothetical protein [Thermococcus sp. MV11]NJE03659.1 hypothetical protein [Thermococcus sp. MV11]
MDDILVPKERTDAVVFIGVDDSGGVEFIKVYAVDEEKARAALEEFFSARGLFPADYRLVSRGLEDVSGKGAITTRSEAELSASLARLGLKLLSNGILDVGGLDRVYQFTLVSEELYLKLRRKEEAEKAKKRGLALTIRAAIELGFHTLIVNLRGINLEPLLPEGAKLLREPSPGEVLREMGRGEFQVVVETVWPDKYYTVPFGARIKIPPMSRQEFARELENLVGVPVDEGILDDYPEWLFNYRNLEMIVQIFEKLRKRGMEKEKALETAIFVNLGFVPSEFEGLDDGIRPSKP